MLPSLSPSTYLRHNFPLPLILSSPFTPKNLSPSAHEALNSFCLLFPLAPSPSTLNILLVILPSTLCIQTTLGWYGPLILTNYSLPHLSLTNFLTLSMKFTLRALLQHFITHLHSSFPRILLGLPFPPATQHQQNRLTSASLQAPQPCHNLT